MHMIPLNPGEDEETLKYRVASDPTVISRLAVLADALGFAWCGGTRREYVGEDFDITKSDDRYVLQAHYDANDPHAGGYMSDKRLRITLSNFRISVDAATMRFGTPQVRDRKAIAVETAIASNNSTDPAGDDLATTFQYESSTTITNEVSISLTAGIAVSTTGKVGVPLVAEAEETVEYSISASAGWTYSEATTKGTTLSQTYTAHMPPLTKRVLTLMATEVRSDVDYTTDAVIDFDVEFYGFLKFTSNARHDHPTDRPFVTVTFKGLSAIVDMYEHREIPNSSEWDWRSIQENVDWLINWMREKIGVTLRGTFKNMTGIDVHIVAGELEAIPAPDTPSAPGDAILVAPADDRSLDSPVRVISVSHERVT